MPIMEWICWNVIEPHYCRKHTLKSKIKEFLLWTSRGGGCVEKCICILSKACQERLKWVHLLTIRAEDHKETNEDRWMWRKQVRQMGYLNHTFDIKRKTWTVIIAKEESLLILKGRKVNNTFWKMTMNHHDRDVQSYFS